MFFIDILLIDYFYEFTTNHIGLVCIDHLSSVLRLGYIRDDEPHRPKIVWKRTYPNPRI